MSKPEYKCVGHKQAIVVTKSPVRILAGGKGPGTAIPLGSTVLALGVSLESPITGLPGLESKVVRVDWPDMSVPAIDAEGWRKIAKALAALRKPIYVSCNAGHGRTGTALAILCHMLGQMPKKVDPVDWIRQVYCPQAVETQAQVAYVALVTGRESKSKASAGEWSGQGYAGSKGGTSTYTPGVSKTYEEGMVWDTKTGTWKSGETKKYDFNKKGSGVSGTVFCKGQGDRCSTRVSPPVVFCTKCQDKEQVNADGTPKGAIVRVSDTQALSGTDSALDDVTGYPRPDHGKYFPGNTGK